MAWFLFQDVFAPYVSFVQSMINYNKKVKSPYNWVISPLTQLQVANQQKILKNLYEQTPLLKAGC